MFFTPPKLLFFFFIYLFIYYLFILILQDIPEAHAGQIVAVFGVDCASGPTHPFACVHMIFYNFVLFSLVV